MTGSAPGSGAVEALDARDLPAIVSIHLVAFPESAMSLLGARVVDRYYRWQLEGPHPESFAAGYRRGGAIVGFVVGGVHYGAITGFARRYFWTVALAALTHPRGAARLFGPQLLQVARFVLRRVLRRPVSPPPTVGPNDDANVSGARRATSFGILSLAVLPSERGSGAATALVEAAEARARALGLESVHLSVGTDNARAIRFYERSGFVKDVVGVASTPDGSPPEWRGRMVKRLDVAARGGDVADRAP